MPADSLTMRRANRHVCCPLIFIELLLEQLFYNRHDVTSREEPTVTLSWRLETCSARHRRSFSEPTTTPADLPWLRWTGTCTRPGVKLAWVGIVGGAPRQPA